MKLRGENRSTRGKTCPSATLSTTNPTCNSVTPSSGTFDKAFIYKGMEAIYSVIEPTEND
jgi:hypothetical protein